MRRAVALVVLFSLSVVAGASPAPQATDGPDRASNPILAPEEDFDRTRFTIQVSHNGTARWTFRYMRILRDNESVTAFQEYADRFESEDTELYLDFVDRATALARIGRNHTGREMNAEGFSKRAYVDRGINDVGVVQMSFQWTAFAQVEDPRVVMGDVFEGGLFLGQDQSLVVKPGSQIVFESVAPNGTVSGETLSDSDSVTWQGEREFSDQRPRVIFVSKSAPTSTTTAGTDTSGTDGQGPTDTEPPTERTTSEPGTTVIGQSDGEGFSPIVLAIGALIVIAGLVGGVAYRRDALGSGGEGLTADRSSGSEGPGGANAAPAVPESAMLSDEERVVDLLENHGGRMHQVDIVEETDWSKSKVSMLLSEMESDGKISKLRVGRENIVSLAGQEPDAAGSPFDDREESATENDE